MAVMHDAAVTGCTASRYADHDYSRPPHNTPQDPRTVDAEDPCQVGYEGCEDDRRYEVVLYQPGTHEWIRMYACVPCMATLRTGPHPGPGGIEGIVRIRDYRGGAAAAAGMAA